MFLLKVWIGSELHNIRFDNQQKAIENYHYYRLLGRKAELYNSDGIKIGGIPRRTW